MQFRDFKAHNIARSLRNGPQAAKWIVIDSGEWLHTTHPKVRQSDQLAEVRKELNKHECFDKLVAGTWNVCLE